MVFACLLLKLLYLISLFALLCVGEDKFTIIRSSTGSLTDKFIVPSGSKCGSSPSQCAASYPGANNLDPTQCKCACRFEYSTFGFYNGAWICLVNSKVRQQTGCTFMFEGEAYMNPLRILTGGSFRYKIISPSIYCTIDQSASRYLGCDGTWAALGQSSNFQLLPITENIGNGNYKYTMKVGTPTSLAGRLVSLHFSCTNPPKSSCLLFKMAGTIICPVNVSHSLSTQNPLFTVTQTPNSVTPTRNSSTEAPGPGKGAPNSGQSGPSSSGTVAAVVVIIIIIIIIAAIIGYVIWKRKRGENVLFMDRLTNIARKVRSQPTTKKVEEPEQIYAEIPEQPTQRQAGTKPDAPIDLGIYSFAFDDPDSAYAPPQQQDQHSLYEDAGTVIQDKAPTDDRGYMVPVDSPFYDVLEAADEQTTDGDDGKEKTDLYDNQQEFNDQPNSSHGGGVGSSVVTPAVVPGPSGVAGTDRYVTKQRRRPPSPPRKR